MLCGSKIFKAIFCKESAVNISLLNRITESIYRTM